LNKFKAVQKHNAWPSIQNQIIGFQTTVQTNPKAWSQSKKVIYLYSLKQH